jgi:hypothetical protein
MSFVTEMTCYMTLTMKLMPFMYGKVGVVAAHTTAFQPLATMALHQPNIHARNRSVTKKHKAAAAAAKHPRTKQVSDKATHNIMRSRPYNNC